MDYSTSLKIRLHLSQSVRPSTLAASRRPFVDVFGQPTAIQLLPPSITSTSASEEEAQFAKMKFMIELALSLLFLSLILTSQVTCQFSFPTPESIQVS